MKRSGIVALACALVPLWAGQSRAEGPGLVVATAPQEAKPPVESPGVGTCLVLPEHACEVSPIAELTLAGGESSSYIGTRWLVHFGLTVGLTAPLDATQDVHLGPVIDIAVDGGDVTIGSEVAPKLRVRYWVDGSDFVIEGGAGLAFQRFAFDDGLETGTRVGVTTDLAFGYRAMFGPWASTTILADPGGATGSDARWAVGVRANLTAWLVALGGLTQPNF